MPDDSDRTTDLMSRFSTLTNPYTLGLREVGLSLIPRFARGAHPIRRAGLDLLNAVCELEVDPELLEPIRVVTRASDPSSEVRRQGHRLTDVLRELNAIVSAANAKPGTGNAAAPDWKTRSEAARIFGVHPSTVKTWVEKWPEVAEIPARRSRVNVTVLRPRVEAMRASRSRDEAIRNRAASAVNADARQAAAQLG